MNDNSKNIQQCTQEVMIMAINHHSKHHRITLSRSLLTPIRPFEVTGNTFTKVGSIILQCTFRIERSRKSSIKCVENQICTRKSSIKFRAHFTFISNTITFKNGIIIRGV
ncbi:hypothetical protein Dimus_038542 [Dionaea muscipula]